MVLRSIHVMQVPPASGVCIHHLSHPDVASWIERTNRYTSRADRARSDDTQRDLVAFAHARIDHWASRTDSVEHDDYPAAAALLRAVYDIVDRLKAWEEARGQNGVALFRTICSALDAEHGMGGPTRAPSRRQRFRALAMRWLSGFPRRAFPLDRPACSHRPE
jgi:hypothetical protein